MAILLTIWAAAQGYREDHPVGEAIGLPHAGALRRAVGAEGS